MGKTSNDLIVPYHCTTFFLPLGLSCNSSFWNEPYEKWTSLKAFTGEEFKSDHAYFEDVKIKTYLGYVDISFKKKLLLLFCIGLCIILNVFGLLYLYKIIRNKV